MKRIFWLFLFILLSIGIAFTIISEYALKRRCFYSSKDNCILSGDPQYWKPYITKLINHQDLTMEEAKDVWDRILLGSEPIQIAALLVLLRTKGETPQEIAGMVKSLKAVCKSVSIPGKLLDIVGTGGDGADTINISTASVILSAACGCKVAKVGNRSVSSKCGSADVLEKLGIKLEIQPDVVAKCIDQCRIGFMFAPNHHPAMSNVAPIRKALGVRTAFNLIGPITNPANAQHVVIGVFEERLVQLIGDALIALGQVEHAMVVHGCGLDEISPLGPSLIYEIRNIASSTAASKQYETKRYEFDPFSVGIPRCHISDLKGGDVDYNAKAMLDVLSPSRSSTVDARKDAVVLNTAVALYVYGRVSSIAEGVTLAREVLDSGKALTQLQLWIDTSNLIAKQD